jgi:hypothetical protein
MAFPMKTHLPYAAALAAAFFIFFAWSSPSSGEAGADDPAVVALVNDITTQQATITDNQAKIDSKLADIAETVRQARIFAARGK